MVRKTSGLTSVPSPRQQDGPPEVIKHQLVQTVQTAPGAHTYLLARGPPIALSPQLTYTVAHSQVRRVGAREGLGRLSGHPWDTAWCPRLGCGWFRRECVLSTRLFL
jgi:hypothetical protein